MEAMSKISFLNILVYYYFFYMLNGVSTAIYLFLFCPAQLAFQAVMKTPEEALEEDEEKKKEAVGQYSLLHQKHLSSHYTLAMSWNVY